MTIEERVLHFKQPAGTSRGVYTERRIWLVTVTDGDAVGRGECAPLPDLSCDARTDYGDDISATATQRNHFFDCVFNDYCLRSFPSGVSCSDNFFVRIEQQNGNAVGG